MTSYNQNLESTSQDDQTVLDTASKAVTDGQADDLACILNRHKPSSGELKWLALLAAESLSLSTLQVLLDNGWDINVPESYVEPPLLGRAIRNGASEDVVRWFLKHGADPNACAGKYETTPLSLAVQFAPIDIVQLLLDHGGSVEKGDLVNFVCKRPANDPTTLPLLSQLHEKGAPIDNALFETNPDLVDVTRFCGTPLWISSEVGNVAAVRYLLEHGASPWKKPFYAEDLPLDVAKRSGHQEIVNLLSKTSAT